MNCANHPEVAVTAYCQSCGKPLCTACMRSVGGIIYCEPCLAARLSSATAGPAAYGQPDLTGLHANPVLAGLLGFIPGVGAMYNGQFVKALAHVLIFAVFVSLSNKSFVFGLLVAAWVFYQVFDAAQTAKARRDGLPLPNPFGLNDLGVKLGMPPGPHPYAAGFTAPVNPGNPSASGDPGSSPAAGPSSVPPPPPAYSSSYAVPPPPFTQTPFTPTPGPVPPISPSGPVAPGPGPLDPRENRYPVGAVVLIAIGTLLLLQTLGVLEEEWISRAWPLVLIGIGGWLLYRRTRANGRGGL